MSECTCVVVNRQPGELQREWFKRWMCMHHWVQSDYYQAKLEHKWEFYMNGSFCSRCGAAIGSGVECK